jgi:hypothetical protein
MDISQQSRKSCAAEGARRRSRQECSARAGLILTAGDGFFDCGFGILFSSQARFEELHETAGSLVRCEEGDHDLPPAAALASEFFTHLDQREVIAEMSA